MRALLGTLVLLGLVVLLWPAISKGLGAILPWAIGIIIFFGIVMAMGDGSSNKTPPKAK